ncbi:DUF300-domain-containing protein [Pseudovirgaria hyperparasitica]|uniref:DUF300-domain-containing protein n=1 Tax=Pseudovirgaria hyperparasitica TaxID=470096 RepID=A0A6A6WMD4_9PEZI|nr:DUF300-domain-containing protein [Pseudovirgaria hyperparasitica]KAF2763380.1 DUF300-domain-containing protein [Pseudovirgaria hyperparasitica]
MPTCNTTLTDEIIEETPLFNSVKFHHIGLIVSAVFGLIAVVVALWLMMQHAWHYSVPTEQRHIIRILFMIPIYATVSFLSYLFYRHAIYFEVLRDCYEAFAIASFFALLCNYLAPNLHDQKEYFRSITPKNWLFPLTWVQKCTGGQEKGPFRVPKSGLTWFNVIWVSVFQYCFIRVFFTVVSVVTQVGGRYCESSLNPAFAHVWVMVFEGVAVTIAMYALIQFYYQLKPDIADHRPLLKILSIKLVIFFSFWQTIVINFLVSSGAWKPSDTIDYPDIKVGIPSMLLCIEMALFAVLHIWSFSWKEYDLSHKTDDTFTDGTSESAPKSSYQGGPLGIKALLDAFNPWDLVKSTGRGFRWLFVGARKRHHDVSYQKGTHLGNLNGSEPQYTGITFAGNGEPANSLYHPSNTGYESYKEQRTYGGLQGREDDNAGLLSHAQAQPTNPYTGVYSNTTHPDSLPSNPTPASATYRPAQPQRTFSYESNSGYEQVTLSGPGQPHHPQSNDWNVFGGVGQAR